jgi:hypothetical protein
MPDRYHVHTNVTPGRFHRVGKFGDIDWREDCSRCANCVKLRCCFDVYKHESAHNRDPIGAIETLYECKACLSCVQGCTKGLLSLSVNPEFLMMGDDYWKPDMILSTWKQSDSGTIPVSGAGYRGRFHGPGFDSIWTDMSEIVRPTRDGIHGREYISTSVDIGPKPMRLEFSPAGEMLNRTSPLLEVQMPAILDVPAWPMPQLRLAKARALAAKELRTLAPVFAREAAKLSPDLIPYVIPICISSADITTVADKDHRIVQLLDSPEIGEMAGLVRSLKPQMIVSARLTLDPTVSDRIIELSRNGIKVFHLCADLHGRERISAEQPGRHIKDVLREIHGRLVDAGIRDEITLIISGGIALAEHMAKAVICGADLVAVDTALLVALGCRVCRNQESGIRNQESHGNCPIQISTLDVPYASQRIINLMGAWHSQLIEVLGAMGIREVRRLRGEMGRAIFMEEIEKEAFGDLLRTPVDEEIA